MAKRRRRWEEELEREPERPAKPRLAELDTAKRAGVLEELQRAGGNRALQQVVAGPQLQREAARATAPAVGLPRPFMRIVGEVQGPIKGASTYKGHEGEFELVENYELEAKAPMDKATGQSSGHRQFSELKVVVRKSVGIAKLRHAFSTSESLEIVVMTPIEDGIETTTLTKARVVGVKDLANGTVELRFVFDKVTWGAGEVETGDRWKQPN